MVGRPMSLPVLRAFCAGDRITGIAAPPHECSALTIKPHEQLFTYLANFTGAVALMLCNSTALGAA